MRMMRAKSIIEEGEVIMDAPLYVFVSDINFRDVSQNTPIYSAALLQCGHTFHHFYFTHTFFKNPFVEPHQG